MAKPYREGAGWAFRLRIAGEDVYRSGLKSKAAALREMEMLKGQFYDGPTPAGLGPHRTSLGVAFSDYARERLPYLKGAEQDARRINRYLRLLNLPVIELEPVELEKDGKRIYWQVSFTELARTIPASLVKHRNGQDAESAESDRVRKRLAAMMVADVTTYHIQALINALRDEGKKSATIHLERSELRRLFKHTSAVWKWKRAGGNPAGAELDMPSVEGGRDRVLSNEEWLRVSAELAKYPNPYVAPLACLMLETAMRSCEPLMTLRWSHIKWEQRVFELPDAKAGRREVPLGPGALHVLKQMKDLSPIPLQADDKVFPTTYEAVKKAWSVARQAAGIPDVNLHDLRHTSATRFSLEYKGDVDVMKVITGHKTTEMVSRYVHVKATDVATMMHGEELDVMSAAAGYKMSAPKVLDAARDAFIRKSTLSSTRVVPEPSPGLSGVSSVVHAGEAPVAMREQVSVSPTVRSAPAAAMRSGNVIAVNFQRRMAS